MSLWTLLLLAGSAWGWVEITDLPGLNETLNFRHYSGYLNVSHTHTLHYWFTESQKNPAKDPFLLWMNGGPGCSSLDGLLSELGPFHIRPDAKTLYLNPWSWNREANVLFLEAPAGVGFSYSSDGNVTTTDDQVAEQNYQALKVFFEDFPQFRNHDFYVTGESYGGIYVPTLVTRILDGLKDYPLNIKGMAIGNGMLSYYLNTNTLLNFVYNHGLIDQQRWELVQTSCCKGCSDTCDFNGVKTKFCQDQVMNMSMIAWNMGLNAYNMYADCYTPPNVSVAYTRFRNNFRHLSPVQQDVHDYYDLVKPFVLEDKKDDFAHDGTDKKKKKKDPYIITDDDLKYLVAHGGPPCLNSTAVILYLNQPSVRAALDIPNYVQEWMVCSDKVGATYIRTYEHQYENVEKALNHGLRVLIYNGDVGILDMACNFLMGQEFSSMLRLPKLQKKTAWWVKDQIAGYQTRYKGLDFLTVKGSGHMVPTDRPEAAFRMIMSYLNKEEYGDGPPAGLHPIEDPTTPPPTPHL